MKAVVVILILTCVAGHLHSATGRSWSGASLTSGNWSVAANWEGSALPVAGDTLLFPPTGARRTSNTNNFASGTVFSAITFGDTGYRLRGNPVTITNSINAALDSGTNTIDLDIALGPSSITLRDFASPDRININGDINLGSRTLTISGPGNFQIGGIISGTGNLFKNNGGDLLLSGLGANTFSGSTTVAAGILRLDRYGIGPNFTFFGLTAIPGDLSIGSGSGGVIGDIVALERDDQIGNSSDVLVYGSGSLELNDQNDTIGSLSLLAGTVLTGDGTLTLNRNVQVSAGSENSLISGHLDLGSGSQRVFNVVSGAQLDVTAQISGGSGITLVKTNRGALYLSASNTFSGPVEILGGLVTVAHGSALGTTNGSTRLHAATLSIHDVGTFGELLDVQSFGGTLMMDAFSAAWNGPVVLNESLTVSAPTNRILTITGQISGPGGITKIDEGGLQFKTTYTNTFSGPSRILNGSLTLDGVFHQTVVSGPLSIGDSGGPAGSVRVHYIKNHQIGDDVPVVVNSSGVLAINGFSDIIGSLSGTGSVELASAALTVGENNSSTVFSGSISGALGRLDKLGSGTFTLSGPNSYSGQTRVGAGRLVVNGNIAASSQVIVSNNAALAGTGTVGPLLVNGGGTLSPGNSPGTLHVMGDLVVNGIMEIELNGTAPAQFDAATASGNVNLTGGTLNLTVNFLSSAGDAFRIIDKTSGGAVAGNFTGLPNGATFAASGQLFRIAYAGGTGNDVTLFRISPPASSISSIQAVTSERMLIQGQGFPGVQYVLEATPHLNKPIPWAAIATNNANAGGVYEFVDPYSEAGTFLYPARFYRVYAQ